MASRSSSSVLKSVNSSPPPTPRHVYTFPFCLMHLQGTSGSNSSSTGITYPSGGQPSYPLHPLGFTFLFAGVNPAVVFSARTCGWKMRMWSVNRKKFCSLPHEQLCEDPQLTIFPFSTLMTLLHYNPLAFNNIDE